MRARLFAALLASTIFAAPAFAFHNERHKPTTVAWLTSGERIGIMWRGVWDAKDRAYARARTNVACIAQNDSPGAERFGLTFDTEEGSSEGKYYVLCLVEDDPD